MTSLRLLFDRFCLELDRAGRRGSLEGTLLSSFLAFLVLIFAAISGWEVEPGPCFLVGVAGFLFGEEGFFRGPPMKL